MATETGDNLPELGHERRRLRLKERNQPDFQVDEACVNNQETSDGMQQLSMGRASGNWDIPIYHEGSEQTISGSDDKFYVDSDVPPEDRRYTEFW